MKKKWTWANFGFKIGRMWPFSRNLFHRSLLFPRKIASKCLFFRIQSWKVFHFLLKIFERGFKCFMHVNIRIRFWVLKTENLIAALPFTVYIIRCYFPLNVPYLDGKPFVQYSGFYINFANCTTKQKCTQKRIISPIFFQISWRMHLA